MSANAAFADVIHYFNPNFRQGRKALANQSLPGGHSEWEPPDPIPNSEVKLLSADDSVGSPHAKVGHCQALYQTPVVVFGRGGFSLGMGKEEKGYRGRWLTASPARCCGLRSGGTRNQPATL